MHPQERWIVICWTLVEHILINGRSPFGMSRIESDRPESRRSLLLPSLWRCSIGTRPPSGSNSVAFEEITLASVGCIIDTHTHTLTHTWEDSGLWSDLSKEIQYWCIDQTPDSLWDIMIRCGSPLLHWFGSLSSWKSNDLVAMLQTFPSQTQVHGGAWFAWAFWFQMQLCRSWYLWKSEPPCHARSRRFAAFGHTLVFPNLRRSSRSSRKLCTGNFRWSCDGIFFTLSRPSELCTKLTDRWIRWSQMGFFWWFGHAILLFSRSCGYLQ